MRFNLEIKAQQLGNIQAGRYFVWQAVSEGDMSRLTGEAWLRNLELLEKGVKKGPVWEQMLEIYEAEAKWAVDQLAQET